MKTLNGKEILDNPKLNKGTAYTVEEQRELGLLGLVPEISEPLELQVKRVIHQLGHKNTDFESYLYLMDLLDRNETLFYKVIMSDPARFLPLIYTPTIGEACKKYDAMIRHPRGMYLSMSHQGEVKKILSNWPEKDVRFICVTNGGRILGLGDLGANGMPIPIGKLQLYTAAAGVDPKHLMPLYLDSGTDNEELLQSPFYLGLRQARVHGPKLYEFIDEFIQAAIELFPNVCIHFEDWGGTDAVKLLAKYKDHICCFNDDIQGTASVVLAGLINASKITKQTLSKQRFLFLGAGSAAIGIADLIVSAMTSEGISEEEARKNIAFFNTKGLVCSSRHDLKFFQKPYAQDLPPCFDLISMIEQFKPTGLIGVSTVGGAFDQQVIETMSRVNERPIIFALSNPMTHAECTAKQAYEHSDGRAIFAAGVQFAPVTYKNKTFMPGQANNFYIFPALGLAVFATQAKRITDEMFIQAAVAVANQVNFQQLDSGSLYPCQSNILESEVITAVKIAEYIFDHGLTHLPRPDDIDAFIRSCLYEPSYESLV